MTCGRQPLKVNQSSGFQMVERFEHSPLTPSIPSGLRRSWEDPGGKVGSPWCFSNGTVCYINIWYPAELNPCWSCLQNPITTSFIIYLIIWCHCWSDTKITTRLRHITFRFSHIGGVAEISFSQQGFSCFPLGDGDKSKIHCLQMLSMLVWFGHPVLCFLFSFFRFVNISGMHLNHVAVLLSHYEPLW